MRILAASRSAGAGCWPGGCRLPFWTVDADVVVPSAVFGRSYFLLHHFRPHLKAELPKYLVAPEKIVPLAPVGAVEGGWQAIR